MPANFKTGDFDYDLGEAVAEINQGKYGEEHDEGLEDLIKVINGTRKEFADRLRKYADSYDVAEDEFATIRKVANMLDPYDHEDSPDGSFSRTVAVGDDGAKWFS